MPLRLRGLASGRKLVCLLYKVHKKFDKVQPKNRKAEERVSLPACFLVSSMSRYLDILKDAIIMFFSMREDAFIHLRRMIPCMLRLIRTRWKIDFLREKEREREEERKGKLLYFKIPETAYLYACVCVNFVSHRVYHVAWRLSYCYLIALRNWLLKGNSATSAVERQVREINA